MQRIDRIEKRRFVGREFLLWLWFESELFDATLSTREQGTFGLWLEKRLVLSEGQEKTSIVGPSPGAGREAKEALLRGQLPESAGVRIAWHGDETSFTCKAESLGVAGLKLKTVLGAAEDEPNPLLEELRGAPAKRPRRAAEPEELHEVFYERMHLTGEFEALLEQLFRDFLALRLSDAWDREVVPLLRKWVLGVSFELAPYAALRHASVPVRSDVVELGRASVTVAN
ncbi:MAG TPA: hypothetical protein VFZ61_26915 [Polyangiales bacterium]